MTNFFQSVIATLPVLVVTRSIDLSFNVLGDELKKVSSLSRERSGRTGARRGIGRSRPTPRVVPESE
jgi:hypothetical protein